MFQDFGLISDYLGIVIPIGISAAATTLMCLVSAKEAGDPYPVVRCSLLCRRGGMGGVLSPNYSPFALSDLMLKTHGFVRSCTCCCSAKLWYVGFVVALT